MNYQKEILSNFIYNNLPENKILRTKFVQGG